MVGCLGRLLLISIDCLLGRCCRLLQVSFVGLRDRYFTILAFCPVSNTGVLFCLLLISPLEGLPALILSILINLDWFSELVIAVRQVRGAKFVMSFFGFDDY